MTGVFSKLAYKPDPGKCFVMMPFSNEFSAIYRLIQRCCTEQGLTCVRADEDVSPGKITGKIYEMVSAAGVMVVDMTGRNPNVFYELGLAHAISDNVILLTQATEDVPFDLRDFLHIRYTNTFDGAEKLAADLSKVLSAILSSAKLQMPLDDVRRKKDVPKVDQVVPEELDLGMAHLQAEIARGLGNMREAEEWLRKALDAAKDGKGDAAELGNCAIEAERCKFLDLAEALYEVALGRDGTHLNNRQSYVSFLLDHRSTQPAKMELAGSLLAGLEKTTNRQERTRGLKAQYLTLVKQRSGEPLDFDSMIAEVIGDGKFPTVGAAAPAMHLLQSAGRFDELRTLIERLRKTLPNDQAVLDRVLADALASSEKDSLRQEAIALYSDLLETGRDDSPDVKHNLATLLNSGDRKDAEARVLRLWSEAYAERPTDRAIRKSFAQFLIRQDRKEDAGLVLAGRPLSAS